MATRVGDHAVVVGGSIAGLLAARVLAETHARVTVVERDALPAEPAHRRGVPQARHVHGLLPMGHRLLEELFEGLTEELLVAGALPGDSLGNVRLLLSGQRLAQTSSGAPGLFLGRPLLEAHVRRRVRQVPNVVMLDCHNAVDLVTTQDRRRVIGIRVHAAQPEGMPETVCSDLVVDATGRGSRTPKWLSQLGYPNPPRDEVQVGVQYASRLFRLRPEALGGDKLVITGGTATHPRGGALEAIEGGRHLASVAGVLGDRPPVELPDFLQFCRTLAFPDMHDALIDATPLDGGARFGYPFDVRVRYERVERFPAGLLVIGDAVCSLNPTYGQGMTVAALQAVALRRMLARGVHPEAGGYFHEIAKVIDPAWDAALSNDLANPGVVGRRTLRMRLVNTYVAQFHAAAAADAELARAFVRVNGFLDPPQTLLRPDRMARVLATSIRTRASAHRRSSGSMT